ncbi:TSUP family transporter [Vibrio astriarenae]|uniref:Probable membrane transporter protein n=1 Tax=Vibrio astriarenae TaxID=1481923 RepID=A0A7Z2T267_9VIBR|nr:sulfite exporter TauE/SafE family protein [Vibrio astriarenae]QIA62906.1 TSUP family transporter [Vibrio astriarenae]
MTILNLLQLGLTLGGLIFIVMLIKAWRVKRDSEVGTNTVAVGAIGGIANFCDTLGVGSFAIKTAGYKQFNLVDDKDLPGTLNAQAALATVAQALIFLTAVEVDMTTMVSLIVAACLGATIGARIVSGLDRQVIRLIMGCALLVVAILMLAGRLELFPLGGTELGLSGTKLVIAIVGNFIFGALMTVGIGLYAPCMTMIYLLGMNPIAAFPIMMCSCAFLCFFSAGSFIQRQALNTRAALSVAITGPIAVLIAAFIVKSLDLDTLAWLVTVVVFYTSITMFRSWSKGKAELRSAPVTS